MYPISMNAWETQQTIKKLQHTIDFIEYNMKEIKMGSIYCKTERVGNAL